MAKRKIETGKILEKDVQRAILDYLKAEKILYFRQNTGMLFNGQGRPVRFGVEGMADILSFPRVKVTVGGEDFKTTHPLWIECKSPTGTQKADQRTFEEMVVSEGHSYMLARSVDDVREWMGKWRAT